MSSFFPRVRARVLALATATLAISVFLPVQTAQAAAATHLELTSVEPTATANRTIDQVTVTARDANNQIDQTFSGTVTFTATCNNCFSVSTNSDMSSPLAGNSYQFQPLITGEMGTKDFYVRWNETAVGAPQRLHVSGSGVTAADAGNTTTVASNNPAILDWQAPQTNATQNVSEGVPITIKNAAGETNPNAYIGTVTFSANCTTCFAITPNNGTGHEHEYTFKTADNSTKTFSLTWTTPGTGRTFTAAGTNLPSATSSKSRGGITVSASSATTTTSSTSTSTTSTTLAPHTKTAMLVTGAARGGGPHVIARDASDPGQIEFSFFAYNPAFTGGVRVATGDINNDGYDDIITAAGPGGGPHVQVFSGKPVTGGTAPTLLASFFAYDPGFTGGVFVAAGDVNGDGKADVVTSPDGGGGPHVRVFDGNKLATGDYANAPLLGFMAYDPGFTGGVRVGTADYNGDGKADIVTAPGPGGGPHVRVWQGSTGAELGGGHGFFAYDPSFSGGVYVAGLNAQQPFIITGAGAGGGRHVRIFTLQGAEQNGFMADPTSTQGAIPTVGRTQTAADGFFFVSRATGNPAVQRFSLDDAHQISAFPAYQAGVGVFIAVGVF